MTTQFEQLVENTTFDPSASAFLQSIAGHRKTNNAVKLLKNFKHIQKEASEGILAIEEAEKAGQEVLTQEQTKAVRDAIADVRVLLDGFAQMVDFDLLGDYKTVLGSLITRFDVSEEDALKTKEKYIALGVETRIHHDEETNRFVTIAVDGSKAEDPTEYPEGKWLKSYKFSEPKFTDASLITIAGRGFSIKDNLTATA